VSIRQNSFYTLTGALTQVAVTLFTVPIFLRLIGTERYGVLAIVWVFLGFFGVFDLGVCLIVRSLDLNPRLQTG
jgi:O-antigen/teichoic acid export membrane protein